MKLLSSSSSFVASSILPTPSSSPVPSHRYSHKSTAYQLSSPSVRLATGTSETLNPSQLPHIPSTSSRGETFPSFERTFFRSREETLNVTSPIFSSSSRNHLLSPQHILSPYRRKLPSVYATVPYSPTYRNASTSSTVTTNYGYGSYPSTSSVTDHHTTGHHSSSSSSPDRIADESSRNNTIHFLDVQEEVTHESELCIHGKSYFPRSNQLRYPIEPTYTSHTLPFHDNGKSSTFRSPVYESNDATTSFSKGSQRYIDSPSAPRRSSYRKHFRSPIHHRPSYSTDISNYPRSTTDTDLFVKGSSKGSLVSPIHSSLSPVSLVGTPLLPLHRNVSSSLTEKDERPIVRLHKYRGQGSCNFDPYSNPVDQHDANITDNSLSILNAPPSIVRISEPYVTRHLNTNASSIDPIPTTIHQHHPVPYSNASIDNDNDDDDDYDGFAEFLNDASILTKYNYNPSLDAGIRFEILPNQNLSLSTVSLYGIHHDSSYSSFTDQPPSVHQRASLPSDNSIDNEQDDQLSVTLSYSTGGDGNESNQAIERKSSDTDNHIVSFRSSGNSNALGSVSQYSYQSRSSILSPTSVVSTTSSKPYVPKLQFRLEGISASVSQTAYPSETSTIDNLSVPTLSGIPTFQDEFMMMAINGEMSDTWRAEAGLLPTVMHGV